MAQRPHASTSLSGYISGGKLIGRTLTTLIVLAATAALAVGCGNSSNSSSSSSTRSTTVVHPASLAALKRLPVVQRRTIKAHFTGLQGLSVAQKLQSLAGDVSTLWAFEFRRAQLPFTPPAVNVVDQAPATCGS